MGNKKNYKIEINEIDLYGKKYSILYSTNNFGFREYKTKGHNEIKVLVIGDSFTMDQYTSNKNAWFAVMANEWHEVTGNKISIYAGGGGGYGTLQQYLLAKKYIKKIEPDFFILQFCSNDFINNSHALETNSSVYSQFMRRPYYDSNSKEIFYHNSFYSFFFKSIIGESRLFNKIVFEFSKLKSKYFKKNKKNLYDSDINQALITTSILLKKMRDLFKNNNIFAFNCDNKKYFGEKDWKVILSNAGYNVLNETETQMLKYIKKEKIYFRDHGHYNNLGNELLGTAIFGELKNKNKIQDLN